MRRALAGLIPVLLLLSGCLGLSSKQSSTLSGAVKIVTPSPESSPVVPLNLRLGTKSVPFGQPVLSSIDPGSRQPTYEYIVTFSRAIDTAEVRRTVERLGFAYVREAVDGYHVVRDPQRRPAEAALALLAGERGVISVEENGPVTLLAGLADPYYGEQWALEAIRAQEAWERASAAGAAAVIVAVLDTAIDFSQPDLADPRLWVTGWDAESGGDYGYGERKGIDPDWHGTGVAGVIGAIAGNGYGIRGVAPGVRLMPIRVVGFPGARADTVASGIQKAVERGAHIINLSLQVGSDPQCPSIIDDVLARAVSAGVIVVAAAGNSGGPVVCPASHPGVIAVGAIDRHLQVTPYSAKGADLDLVAPGGSEVDGSCSAGIWILGTGDSLICKIGTSFAAPHVSGVIALMLSAGFPQDPEKVRALLHMTARRPDDRPGWDASYGYGRLDALGAVASGIPRVMLVQREGSRLWVKVEAQPGLGGRFSLAHAPEGRWSLVGWIDVDDDGEVSPGDYFGEAGPVAIRKGQSLTGLDVILTPYEGERWEVIR